MVWKDGKKGQQRHVPVPGNNMQYLSAAAAIVLLEEIYVSSATVLAVLARDHAGVELLEAI